MDESSQSFAPPPSFWKRVMEGGAIAVLTLLAEVIVRKIGEIDVFGSLFCSLVHRVSDDWLRWSC